MPSILIVVPCYNEYDRLPVDSFLTFAGEHPDIHFLFVDDGSADRTIERLQQLHEAAPEQLRHYRLPDNVGKAEAVRRGIQHALEDQRYTHFGFTDADLAAPLSELLLIRRALGESDARLLLGSRIKRLGAEIHRRPLRHYLGRVFATMVDVVMDIEAYDSQCGLKLFDRAFAQLAFATPFTSRWIFDVEVLARLRDVTSNFREHVLEVPLNHWAEKRGSKVTLGAMLRVPLELIRIRRQYGATSRRLARRGAALPASTTVAS